MAKLGIIKGYGNGKFQPNAAVSRIEALTMIVRAIEDVDEDDLEDAEDADTYKGIPHWAKGYVAIALDAGILEEEDLVKFRPNAAAKRYEVAMLLGKALDVDTNDDYEDLDFGDLKQIPNETLEYLPYLVDEGYITGYKNGKFMPNKPITRAELANIIGRIVGDIDDNDDGRDEQTVAGIFRSYDDEDDTITVRVKGKNNTYDLDSDVEVEIDGDEADLDDLLPGMKVELTLDSNDEVVEISADDLNKIEGKFVSYNADDEEITIEIDEARFTFELDEDVEVEIEIDGDAVDLEDLDEDIDLELEFENGKVVKVEGED